MKTGIDKLKLSEVASRIDAYLKRFQQEQVKPPPSQLPRYFCADAYASGSRVQVTYVSYQGSHSLTGAEARDYLAWLDAGNVGAHQDQQRDAPVAHEAPVPIERPTVTLFRVLGDPPCVLSCTAKKLPNTYQVSARSGMTYDKVSIPHADLDETREAAIARYVKARREDAARIRAVAEQHEKRAQQVDQLADAAEKLLEGPT